MDKITLYNTLCNIFYLTGTNKESYGGYYAKSIIEKLKIVDCSNLTFLSDKPTYINNEEYNNMLTVLGTLTCKDYYYIEAKAELGKLIHSDVEIFNAFKSNIDPIFLNKQLININNSINNKDYLLIEIIAYAIDKKITLSEYLEKIEDSFK